MSQASEAKLTLRNKERRAIEKMMTNYNVIDQIHKEAPGCLIGATERETDRWEVWAQKDKVSLGFAYGNSLEEALDNLLLRVKSIPA